MAKMRQWFADAAKSIKVYPKTIAKAVTFDNNKNLEDSFKTVCLTTDARLSDARYAKTKIIDDNTNLNSFFQEGLFFGNKTCTNTPPNVDLSLGFSLITIKHSMASMYTQMLIDLANNRIYTRGYSGSWKAWDRYIKEGGDICLVKQPQVLINLSAASLNTNRNWLVGYKTGRDIILKASKTISSGSGSGSITFYTDDTVSAGYYELTIEILNKNINIYWIMQSARLDIQDEGGNQYVVNCDEIDVSSAYKRTYGFLYEGTQIRSISLFYGSLYMELDGPLNLDEKAIRLSLVKGNSNLYKVAKT